MHGGWWHIVLNMWTLFIFGASLEGRIGRLGFLSFYLACGLIASFAHAYFNMDSTVPALGASGAIAGVLGAYATTFPRAKITILILIVIVPLFFKVPALAYALIWFGFQFLEGFMNLASGRDGQRHRLVGAYRRLRGGPRSHPPLAPGARPHLRRGAGSVSPQLAGRKRCSWPEGRAWRLDARPVGVIPTPVDCFQADPASNVAAQFHPQIDSEVANACLAAMSLAVSSARRLPAFAAAKGGPLG